MSFSMIGQTHVGNKHPENQDRIITREFASKGLSLIGVADGISQCSYGGSVARFIMEQHLTVDEIFISSGSPIEILKEYLKNLHNSFEDEFKDWYDMLESGASLSLALAEKNGTIHCMWAGDSPIFLTEKIDGEFTTQQISTPDHDSVGALTDSFGAFADFELKHKTLQINPRDIVTVTSDGIENADALLNDKYTYLGFSDMVCSTIIDEMLQNPYADDISITAVMKA